MGSGSQEKVSKLPFLVCSCWIPRSRKLLVKKGQKLDRCEKASGNTKASQAAGGAPFRGECGRSTDQHENFSLRSYQSREFWYFDVLHFDSVLFFFLYRPKHRHVHPKRLLVVPPKTLWADGKRDDVGMRGACLFEPSSVSQGVEQKNRSSKAYYILLPVR